MAPRTPQRLPKSHPRTATSRKKRSGASPSKRAVARTIPGWLWLVAGVGVGMLVTSLIKLAEIPDPGATPVAVQTTKPARSEPGRKPAAEPRPAAKAPAKPETRFDFYTLLPEREVIVPDQRDMTPPAKPEPQPKNTATAARSTAAQQPSASSGERYLLQAGSFRRETEADRRRAQILLLGLDARIEPVQANGDVWYRVHAGPFVSQEKVAHAREMLSGEGIETLLLKQRPAG